MIKSDTRSPAAGPADSSTPRIRSSRRVTSTSGSRSGSCGGTARRAPRRSPRPTQADLERNLIFTLRTAFVQVLQAKAFLALAQDEPADVRPGAGVQPRPACRPATSRRSISTGCELQRVQYESDVQTADVNLRSAKIQLLRLLNDQRRRSSSSTSTGPFDFAPPAQTLDELRQIALDTRPDLKAALAGDRQGQDRPSARGRERIDRSDDQRGRRTSRRLAGLAELQPAAPPVRRRRRQRAAADLRSQSGREAPDRARHHAQREARGRRAAAGVRATSTRPTPR